jgi:perosamine synthetase
MNQYTSSCAKISVSKPFLWGNEIKYVTDAISEGWISSKGYYVDMFEDLFAQKMGRKFAVSVNSGTSALQIALEVLEIRPGDEIIVPDFCMASPALAVLYVGATLVPVDVDQTFNINPSLIEAKITHRTRAIIVVHTYGHPAKMDEIIRISQKHNLRIIEDVAEAMGAMSFDQQAGTFGDIACYSLYANKTITTGEGGMLTFDDDSLCKLASKKKALFFGDTEEDRYVHKSIGYSYRLTNIQAAFGLAQLEHLEEAIERKIILADEYSKVLKLVKQISLPPRESWARHVYWVYSILVNGPFSRSGLQQFLSDCGIETRRFFHPIHLQPFFNKTLDDADFPNSIQYANSGLYLPLFHELTESDIAFIAEKISEYFER